MDHLDISRTFLQELPGAQHVYGLAVKRNVVQRLAQIMSYRVVERFQFFVDGSVKSEC